MSEPPPPRGEALDAVYRCFGSCVPCHAPVEEPDEMELGEICQQVLRKKNGSASETAQQREHDLLELSEIVSKKHLNPGASLIYTVTKPARYLNEPKVYFHFVRHAQAQHNITGIGGAGVLQSVRGAIRDPPLTDVGIEQCMELRNSFPYMNQITHVIVSPLRRTLQTAVYGFNPVFLRPQRADCPKLIAWADLRENGDAPCNEGRGIWAVKEVTSNQGIPIDVSLLGQGWEVFSDVKGARVKRVAEGLYGLQRSIIRGGSWKDVDIDRISLGRIGERKAAHVLVVGHEDLLTELIGYDKAYVFKNAEVRSFVFAPRVLVSQTIDKAPYKLKRVYNCE